MKKWLVPIAVGAGIGIGTRIWLGSFHASFRPITVRITKENGGEDWTSHSYNLCLTRGTQDEQVVRYDMQGMVDHTGEAMCINCLSKGEAILLPTTTRVETKQ